jgi:hypothetical protein
MKLLNLFAVTLDENVAPVALNVLTSSLAFGVMFIPIPTLPPACKTTYIHNTYLES